MMFIKILYEQNNVCRFSYSLQYRFQSQTNDKSSYPKNSLNTIMMYILDIYDKKKKKIIIVKKVHKFNFFEP